MANRMNTYSGGGIPTGGAPLFLGDFATPTAAIGQRMTERMIKQSEADKTARGKSRTAVLKALDFAAIEGLSQKASQDHLNLVNGVSDKWSEILIERDYKLTDQDYLDLSKDKREINQIIANKKHDVALIAHAQNQLTGPNSHMWEPESLDRYTYAVESGDTSGASQILVPQFDMLGAGQKVVSKIKKFDTKATRVYNPETKMMDVVKSNEEAVAREVDMALEADRGMQFNRRKPGGEQRYQEARAALIEFNTQTDVSEVAPTAAETKERTIINLTSAQQAIDDRHDWTGKGMTRKHFQNMAELNNSITRVVSKERAALDEIDYAKGFGIVKRAIVNNEGDLELQGGTKKSPKTKIIELPKEGTSETVAKKLMIDLVDLLKPDEMTSGKLPTNYTDFLETGWEVEVGEIAGNTYYEDLKKEAEKEKPDLEKIGTVLQLLFEDETIEKKEAGLFRWWKGVGMGKGKYNVNNPADMDKLMKVVEDKMGITPEPKVEVSGNTVVIDGKPHTVEGITEEELKTAIKGKTPEEIKAALGVTKEATTDEVNKPSATPEQMDYAKKLIERAKKVGYDLAIKDNKYVIHRTDGFKKRVHARIDGSPNAAAHIKDFESEIKELEDGRRGNTPADKF